jgi:hypothetical protein
VKLANALDLKGRSGEKVLLSAKEAKDPDDDQLTYKWWQYEDADTYKGSVPIQDSSKQDASLTFPADAKAGETIHVICEVIDNGTPPLTRYQRLIVEIKP